MITIERISRATGLLLTVACGLIVSACASVESTPAPALAETGPIAVLPLANFTETPDAGRAAQAIAANTLRTAGVAQVDTMFATDSGDALDPTAQPNLERGLDWARTQHAKYVLTGAVEEWRYKVGVDGEPVVSMTFELRELPAGKVVWSAVGTRSGFSRSSLGGVAQKLAQKLLAPLAAHR